MKNHKSTKNKASESRQRFGSLPEEEYRENYEFQHRHDSSSRNNTDGVPDEYKDEWKQEFLDKNYIRRDRDQDQDRDQTMKREKSPYVAIGERVLDYIQMDQATFGYEGSRRENGRNTRASRDQPNPGSYREEDKFDRFQEVRPRQNLLEQRYNKNIRDEFEYSPVLRYLGKYQEPPRDFTTISYDLNKQSAETSNVARMAFDRYQEDNSRRNSPPQRKSDSTNASENQKARNVDRPSKFVFNPNAPVFISRNRQRKE